MSEMEWSLCVQVCGYDDKTYTSSCAAGCANVGVKSQGACPAVGPAPGGSTRSNFPCTLCCAMFLDAHHLESCHCHPCSALFGMVC